MTDISKIKYAIFDMDGTLIDSNKFLDTITERFFSKRGVPYTKEFLLATKTMSKTAYCTAVKTLTNDPGSIDEIAEEVGEYMMDVYRNEVQLMPNALTLLKKLKSQGTKLCIASATDTDTVCFVLKRLNVLGFFEFVLSCDDIGKDKDEPDVFLKASKRLGAVSPQETLIFEDSTVAIRTAKKAGFSVIGMYDAEETTREKFSEICDLAISDFSELL